MLSNRESSAPVDPERHDVVVLPGGSLASPWRRLAAVATDSALLLCVHLLYFLLASLNDTMDTVSAATDARLSTMSVVLVWLYFWAGWAQGATPGQRLWHIRVVALDGRRPGPVRSLARCLGYAVACVPLKAGLAAAWFHPLHQGWHDVLANTVVVNAEAPRKFSLPSVEKKPGPRPAPHLLRLDAARRGWPLALLGYVTLAVFLTWPLVAHISTRAAGGGFQGDDGVFAWNYWYFREALLNGGNPTSTNLLFYPHRVSLLFHTMNWFNCLLGVGLLQFFNLVTTYNLLVLFTFAACCFSAYWLCCAWTRNRAASFVAALPFGVSPYFVMHSTGHPNLQSAQFIPLFALFFWAALTTGHRRYAFAAGVALALNGLCDWQYLLFSGGLGALLWGGLELMYAHHTVGLAARIRQMVLSFAVGGLLLAPLLLPALAMQRSNVSVDKSGQMGGFKADISDFIASNPYHPLARDNGVVVRGAPEQWIAPGWTVLLLAAAGFWTARRKLRGWMLVTVLFAVGACGPFLTCNGNPPLPAVATLALGGLPGPGVDFPWDNSQLIAIARGAVAEPGQLISPMIQWKLPMRWIPKFIPPLRPFRAPVRLVSIVLLGLSLGVACALTRVNRIARLRVMRVGPYVPGLVAASILFEYWPYPYPAYEVRANPYFKVIAADPLARAIVEVPLKASPATMARQTVHGKAIFVGNLARADDDAFRFLASNALLRNLGDAHFVWHGRPPGWHPREGLTAAVVELRALGTRYVVIDKAETKRPESTPLSTYRTLLQGELHLLQVHEDAEILVYRL